MTKEFLSDIQVEQILEKASAAYRHNKLPKNGHDSFILSLKTYITDRGVMEHVCHNCLGTGKEGRSDLPEMMRGQNIEKLLAQTELLSMASKSKEQLSAEDKRSKEERFLSELQIDHVIQKIRRVLKEHPIGSSEMEELRTALKDPSVLEDACLLCKGTGKKRMKLGGEKVSSIAIDEWREIQKMSKDTHDEVFKREYLCQPVPPMHPDEMDCNDCNFISITERTQREYEEAVPMRDRAAHPTLQHKCRKYNVRVFHEGCPTRIRPCEECYQDLLVKCATEKKEDN